MAVEQNNITGLMIRKSINASDLANAYAKLRFPLTKMVTGFKNGNFSLVLHNNIGCLYSLEPFVRGNTFY